MNGLIEDIAEWQRATFEGGTVEGAIAHLAREVVELAAAPTDAMEMADCALLLVCIADRAGVDLIGAMRTKLAINKQRTWAKADASGVFSHVEEAA